MTRSFFWNILLTLAMLSLCSCGSAASRAVANLTATANGGTTVSDPGPAFVYVANAANVDTVSAFKLDDHSGALTPVPGSPFAVRWKTPGQVAVDNLGRFLFVLGVGSNTISSWSIDPVSGALSFVAGLPTGVLPAAIAVDPADNLVYVVNQLSGDITGYRFDIRVGILAMVPGVPGTYPPAVPVIAGEANLSPKGIAVERHGHFAYVTTNAGIATLAISPDGSLSPNAQPLVPAGESPVAIGADPASDFLFVTDSGAGDGGEGAVYGFAIDASTGALTPVAGSPAAAGMNPRALVVDPSGTLVLTGGGLPNQGVVSVFSLAPANGALALLSSTPLNFPPTPIQLAVDPSGNFFYVASVVSSFSLGVGAAGSITGLDIRANIGKPVILNGFPLPASAPAGIAVARPVTGTAPTI